MGSPGDTRSNDAYYIFHDDSSLMSVSFEKIVTFDLVVTVTAQNVVQCK